MDSCDPSSVIADGLFASVKAEEGDNIHCSTFNDSGEVKVEKSVEVTTESPIKKGLCFFGICDAEIELQIPNTISEGNKLISLSFY